MRSQSPHKFSSVVVAIQVEVKNFDYSSRKVLGSQSFS